MTLIMAHDREEKLAQFGRVLDVMDKLRAKCPWNGAQTWDTLRSLTVNCMKYIDNITFHPLC